MTHNPRCIFGFSFLSGRQAQQANASVRAAFVHVVGDLLQSISVLVSAIIIFFKVRLFPPAVRRYSHNTLDVRAAILSVVT